MLGTKLLLQEKLNKLPKTKRRDYLIECINKNKIIKIKDDESLIF